MIVISNATLSTGKGDETQNSHIIIDGDSIREILPASQALPKTKNIIDATGLIVLPGAIDPHVHFDTPGYTEREDFTHGSMSSAAGGITCVIDMPDTSVPPVTDRASLYSKLRIVGEMSVIDFALWGGVSGNEFRTGKWRPHMATLKHEGIVGFKCYLLSGMPTFEHLLPLELVEVMRRAGELKILVGLHAEDRALVISRTAAVMTALRSDPMAYYDSRCEPAELNGIKTGVTIAQEVGCPLHIVHVGSSAGADYAIQAKAGGLDVTMETCPHFLAFSSSDFKDKGSVLKTAPVVKTKADSEGIWKYLANGGIDFVASDHAPCPEKDKNTGSIWTDYGGISGTETLFPYAFSEGYMKKRFTLERLVEVTSAAAAKRYGLYPKKGSISPGTDADLIFVDPKAKWKVQGGKFFSLGKLTPFEGMEFTGKVVRTMCRGTTVYEEGKFLVEPGFGRFIRRGAL